MFKHLSILIVSLRQTALRHGPARSAESLPIADRTGPYAGRAGHKCAPPHAYADCQAGPGRPGLACRADRAETVAGHTRAPPHTHDCQGRAGPNGPDLRADHVAFAGRAVFAGPGRAGRGGGAQATMASRSMCAATCSHARRSRYSRRAVRTQHRERNRDREGEREGEREREREEEESRRGRGRGRGRGRARPGHHIVL
jgi:hypothetical protein